MNRNLSKQRKKLLMVFLEYGFHFWLLIFICNVVIFYAFRFFIMASTESPLSKAQTSVESPGISPNEIIEPTITVEEASPTPSPSPSVTPTPMGPVINLSFSMPGIGTNGGNLSPIHPERDISVRIYKPDWDTGDNSVKPVKTITAKVVYDADPNSPTYTYFINPYIDLGQTAYDMDSFQIAFKAPQSLLQLIKDTKPGLNGGKLFRGGKRNLVDLPVQNLISGEIYPPLNGDNVMDINDYNMLTDCFNTKVNTSKCLNGSQADLDDNGVVDGTDYNLMLLSFRSLLSQGYPIPTIGQEKKIVINPTASFVADKVKKILTPRTTVKPTIISVPVKKSSSGSLGILIVIFILIIIGGGAFGAYKLHLLDSFIRNFKKQSSPKQGSSSDEKAQLPDSGVPVIEAVKPEEKEIFSAGAEKTPDAATAADKGVKAEDSASPTVTKIADTENAAAESAQKDTGTDSSGLIEKSGYLKKGTADESGKGFWVTLADDGGILKGFYEGKSVEDGFVKVKGTMENGEDNKPFIRIKEVVPEE